MIYLSSQEIWLRNTKQIMIYLIIPKWFGQTWQGIITNYWLINYS